MRTSRQRARRAAPGRRRSPIGNLRTQLALVTVVPLTILLLLLAMVGVFSFTRLTQTLVEERDSELVQLAAQQITGYWADSVLLLTQIASDEAVRIGDSETIQTLLENNTALQQRFDEISVTNAQGTVTTTVGGSLGEKVGTLSFYERARRLRRPVRSDTYQNAANARVIAVAVPVFGTSGHFAGCALGVWNLQGDRLGAAVASLRVGDRGFSYLVDKYGTILYHPDEALLGADASRHPAVAALLQGKSGAQTVSIDGQETVVGYAPISLRRLTSSLYADETWDGWGLLTSELWDDIVAPLQPSIRVMIALLLLVIALPLTILGLTSRHISGPLQSLVEQAEHIASGEFDSHVAVYSGPAEVRELEFAFNAMADQLRQYRSDIQNYVVSILNSQEEERKRIARELHDDTAQALVVLGRHIEIATDLASDEELRQELNNVRDMVDDTLHSVRRFTSDLRPPLLEELGLPRTLGILGDRVEREEGFSVDLTISGTPHQLMPELELGLYRLTQEGLSNVRKHANADHARVNLTYSADSIRLEISDDGVGIDGPIDPTELMQSGRLGLMGIYERARLFGGKATITSESGNGTTVVITIPLTAILMPREPKVSTSPSPGQGGERG